MRRIISLSLIALLSLGAAACGSEGGDPTGPAVTVEQTTFAPSLNVDLAAMTRASTGYYFQDLVAGNGDIARQGDSLNVVFTGYLANGTAFAVANQLSFKLGTTPVMEGWQQGLIGAPNGGRRRLIIPPALGYGNRDIVDGENNKIVVPKNSVLVYDITIVSIKH
jgi:FKBP-type peptidyl-prolyl cis-trans isomerase